MPLAEVSAPEPTLRLRVDKDALAHNWRALDRLSGDASAGAAVKANCYGLGVDACVPVLRDAGCEAFFVAHWSEVGALLPHVESTQIAVLHGPVRDKDVALAKAIGAVPVLNSLSQVQRWNSGGGGRCHLMVDTGINRLGLSANELGDPSVAKLEVDILMSHLACADEDSAMNGRQLSAFRDCLPLVTHRRTSLANSAGIALGSEYSFDLTRPGLALYGGIPRAQLADTIRQVAYIDAAIMQTRTLSAGDAVGYNGEFIAQRPMRAGTVSLGYADGFLRNRGPGTSLLHGEASLPIIGKVSMDMIIVDLTDAPELGEGDWLEVPMGLRDAAQQSGLSQYELLTVLGSRLR
ncbi:alanine racemase [Erythrobacter sp. SCSIO 43205]|uniref:alanine racemase n=1 Tax=Erythrobacter sp. SCSIO 43205 TaxID=2779361 RepID=UPI001CA888F6|nr:alanine racemase [Erythrobacter sp. SCSIO 43205]UAB77157.1 alanine racemase [Erythrobacter sp. SCSIO 43205]